MVKTFNNKCLVYKIKKEIKTISFKANKLKINNANLMNKKYKWTNIIIKQNKINKQYKVFKIKRNF